MHRILPLVASVIFAFGQLSAKDYFTELNSVRDNYLDYQAGAKIYFSERFAEGTQEFSNMLNSASSYVDFFATQDERTIKDWEAPIMDMIKAGYYANAITRYERHNLAQEFKTDDSLYPCIERYVMLLELTGMRSNAQKGMTLLQSVVETDKKTLRAMVPAINLANGLRQYTLSDELFGTYYSRTMHNPEQMAEVIAYRAEVCYRRNKPNEAHRLAERAVIMYDSLAQAKDDPKYAAWHRAKLHQLNGSVLHRIDELESSLKNIYQSYALYEAVAEQGEGDNLPMRLRAYYSMGGVLTDLQDYTFADELYQKVDAYGSWLYEGDSYRHARFSFDVNRLRGLSLVRDKKIEDASSAYELASLALDDMERIKPGSNLDDFQNLNFNIASMYYSSGNLEKALEYDIKVLNMLLANTQQEEHRHNNDLAYCYKYIGNCYWAIGYQEYVKNKKRRSKEIMKYYQDAQRSFQLALRHNAKDPEARAKSDLASLIIQGLEKPQVMPKHF